MGVVGWVAGRYLLGLHRRTHVAAVSAISLGAMALGSAALVITLALLEGFQSTIRAQLASHGVHAELRPRIGSTLPTGPWLDELRSRHPELEARVISSGPVWCVGADSAVPATLEASDDVSRVEVNRVLAARLAVGAGSSLTVASPRLTLTPVGPLPTRQRLKIDAVRDVRPGEEAAVLLVPSQVGRKILGEQGPHLVELWGKDVADAWSVASLVQEDLPGMVEVVSFRQLNRPLLAALQLERAMIGLGVGLVIVVAALNLLCNLALVAAEKRADVTLLAALGLPPGRIRALFLSLGMGVGVLGGAVGTAFGAAAATLLDRTGVLPLPRGVFIVSHVPFRVTTTAVVVVLAVSVVAAGVASLVPARAAARRDIPQGLRYE